MSAPRAPGVDASVYRAAAAAYQQQAKKQEAQTDYHEVVGYLFCRFECGLLGNPRYDDLCSRCWYHHVVMPAGAAQINLDRIEDAKPQKVVHKEQRQPAASVEAPQSDDALYATVVCTGMVLMVSVYALAIGGSSPTAQTLLAFGAMTGESEGVRLVACLFVQGSVEATVGYSALTCASVRACERCWGWRHALGIFLGGGFLGNLAAALVDAPAGTCGAMPAFAAAAASTVPWALAAPQPQWLRGLLGAGAVVAIGGSGLVSVLGPNATTDTARLLTGAGAGAAAGGAAARFGRRRVDAWAQFGGPRGAQVVPKLK